MQVLISKNGKDTHELEILLALISSNESYLKENVKIEDISIIIDNYWELIAPLFEENKIDETIQQLKTLKLKSIKLFNPWLWDMVNN